MFRKAFSVLFAVAMSALMLVSTVTPVLAGGPMSVDEFCKHLGYAGSVLVNTTAYGIRCRDSAGRTFEVSLDDLCLWKYGTGSVAKYRDFNDWQTWYCDGGVTSLPLATSYPVSPLVTLTPARTPVRRVTPVYAPTLTPSVNADLACTVALFKKFDRGQVTPGLANRLRSEAGVEFEEIGQIPGEGIFIVLDGPICNHNDHMQWYKVSYQGEVGWTAQAAAGQVDSFWLEHYND